MTFAELQSAVRLQLKDSGTTFFTDQDIKDALNEGYAELADATEFYERQANLPLLAGRGYFDLTSVLPDTFLSCRHVYNTTTSQWLIETDAFQMDMESYGQWEIVTGEAQKYILRGHWWLGIWPHEETDTSNLRIYYTSIPAAMELSTDEPAILREFHPGLVHFACSDLHSQQRETAKAVEYWKEYKEIEERLKLFVEGRQQIAGRRRL